MRFVAHFYASLFATRSVTGSFAHATRMLRTEGLSAEAFTLHRPKADGKRAKSACQMLSPANEYRIAINMDAVADKIDDLGMTREVLHHIAWRMSIDTRILKGARDDALIAVGDVLHPEHSLGQTGRSLAIGSQGYLLMLRRNSCACGALY